MAGYAEEDEEEELREVDPMEVVEERIMILEAWQQEDPYNQDLTFKREEYLGFMEELEILAKKMRKTEKLLQMNNQPNRSKLERKKDQYIREVQDIVMYADQDAFFDVDGEQDDNNMSSYIKANSLLGKPLETLAEMTGFEDSKVWNDSAGALDYKTAQNDRKEASASRQSKQRSSDASFSSINTQEIDVESPGSIAMLRKKVRKVKRLLLESASTEKERQKLLKKHQEYKRKLAEALSKDGEGNDASSTHSLSSSEDDASEGSIDVPQRSPVKVMENAYHRRQKDNAKAASKQIGPPKMEANADYILLKRKLKKCIKLLKTVTNEKERDKLEQKIPDYLERLEEYRDWETEREEYGFGADFEDGKFDNSPSPQSDEGPPQQPQRKSSRALDTDGDFGSSSSLSSAASSISTSIASSIASNQISPPKSSTSVASSIALSTNSLKVGDGEDDEYALLKRKLAKATKLFQTSNIPREKKRLEKKVNDYVSQLSQYDAWEVDQLAYGYGNGKGGSAEEDEDDTSIYLEDLIEKEDKQLEEAEKQKEVTEARHSAAKLMMEARNESEENDELDVAVAEQREQDKILRKKLKKVVKMMKDMVSEKGDDVLKTKEYLKLERKERQYLFDLGESEETTRPESMSTVKSSDRPVSTATLESKDDDSESHATADGGKSVEDSAATKNSHESSASDFSEESSSKPASKSSKSKPKSKAKLKTKGKGKAKKTAKSKDDTSADAKPVSNSKKGAKEKKEKTSKLSKEEAAEIRKKLKKTVKTLSTLAPDSKKYSTLEKKRRKLLKELGEA